jgi:hypothetical protein
VRILSASWLKKGTGNGMNSPKKTPACLKRAGVIGDGI